ncbi:MAG: hypothetical protein FWC50_13430 [Planctomycetaceae bacterium]|nr:hypothetical protein [Planctomycetaceae bacterium]
MTRKKSKMALVRSGFSFQQIALILLAFVMGVASATLVEHLLQQKGFGPNSAVASQESVHP